MFMCTCMRNVHLHVHVHAHVDVDVHVFVSLSFCLPACLFGCRSVCLPVLQGIRNESALQLLQAFQGTAALNPKTLNPKP